MNEPKKRTSSGERKAINAAFQQAIKETQEVRETVLDPLAERIRQSTPRPLRDPRREEDGEVPTDTVDLEERKS